MVSVIPYNSYQPDYQFMDRSSSLQATIQTLLSRDPYIGNYQRHRPRLRLAAFNQYSSSLTTSAPQTPEFEDTMSLDSGKPFEEDFDLGINFDLNIALIGGSDLPFEQEDIIKVEERPEVMTPSHTPCSSTSSPPTPPRDEHAENDSKVKTTRLQRVQRKKKETVVKKVEPRSSRALFQEMINGNRKSKRKGKKQLRLWEFIRGLLESKDSTRHITWVSREEGTFRLLNSGAVANLWGETKNRTDMTYEKMSRAMRYYYAKEILQPIPQKLTYKFGDKVLQEMN